LLLLYRTLPGAYVRWGSALLAAFTAAYGLTLLRIGFTRFVAKLKTVSETYGAISAMIIFILALGLAFTIFLLGISLAPAFQFREELLFHDSPPRKMEETGPMYEAVQLLLDLAVAWRNDRALRTARALSFSMGRPEAEIAPILERLVADKLVVST